MRLPSRIVHLPLSWDDPATQLATAQANQSVRADAPWCPTTSSSSVASTASTREEVRDIVFGASYLVMGLGDVYLGAPVATPLDPRHRLVTTKYNPARTWTPENAVGIGGAYLCVYGMEGPGGYQFVGRTVQMWNRYQQTADFAMASNGCCASSIRSASIPSAAKSCRGCAPDFPTAAIRCASRSRISISATTSGSWRRSVNRSTRSASVNAALSMRSASAGAQRGSPRRRMAENAVRARSARTARGLRRHHIAGFRQRLADQGCGGPGRRKGRHARDHGSHEDGNRRARRHRGHGALDTRRAGYVRACGRHAAGLQAGAVMSLDLTLAALSARVSLGRADADGAGGRIADRAPQARGAQHLDQRGHRRGAARAGA